MKFSNVGLAAGLSLITIIGSLLLGGSNFGSMRAVASINSLNIIDNRENIEQIELSMYRCQMEAKDMLAELNTEMAVVIVILERIEERMKKNNK